MGLYQQTESKQKLILNRFSGENVKQLSQRNIVSIVKSINKFQCSFHNKLPIQLFVLIFIFLPLIFICSIYLSYYFITRKQYIMFGSIFLCHSSQK